MKNLPLIAPRCAGTDRQTNPRICPQRDTCARHLQLELDRQLELPPEVLSQRKVMALPRVGQHDCHYRVVAK